MMAARDTKTRYQGVYARHSISCPKTASKDHKCRCTPTYYGVAYDATKGSTRKTPHLPKATEARNARNDLIRLIDSGKIAGAGLLTLQDTIDRFIKAAEDGVALSKRDKPYREKAITGLRTDLKRIPEKLRHRRLDRLTSADFQHLVDDLVREGLSGSRVRSVINSARSLYRWAKSRGYVASNVAVDVQLPALDSKGRDRVAEPLELINLIDALAIEDRAAFALAAFGGLRSGEIRNLDWPDLDVKAGALLVTDGKTDAANRVIPITAHLKPYLRAEWMRQGRPKHGPVCPARRFSKSGRASMDQVLKKAKAKWKTKKLKPIAFHECRHTCATWLDAAGARPKVVSAWMGHSTPEHQRGAAPITQNTYTHLLDGDLEQAAVQLDAWLKAKLADTGKEAVK